MRASQATCVAQEFLAQINLYIVYPFITLLTAVALLVFLYGGFRFVTNSDDSVAHAEGKKHMLWGIIGLLVMASAVAILEIATNSIWGFGIAGPSCSSGTTVPDFNF